VRAAGRLVVFAGTAIYMYRVGLGLRIEKLVSLGFWSPRAGTDGFLVATRFFLVDDLTSRFRGDDFRSVLSPSFPGQMP